MFSSNSTKFNVQHNYEFSAKFFVLFICYICQKNNIKKNQRKTSACVDDVAVYVILCDHVIVLRVKLRKI